MQAAMKSSTEPSIVGAMDERSIRVRHRHAVTQAQQHLRDKNVVLALRCLAVAIELRPDDHTSHVLMARLATSMGTWDLAEAHSRAALSLKPKALTTLLTMANLKEAQGQGNEALDWSMRAVASEPDNAGAWYSLAKAQLAAGNLRLSKQAIDRAMDLKPRTPDFLVFAARLVFRMGAIDEASAMLESAAASANPETAASCERTRATIRRFLSLAPRSTRSLTVIAALHTKEEADAVASLLRLLDRQPRHLMLFGNDAYAGDIARRFRFQLPIIRLPSDELASALELSRTDWLAFLAAPVAVNHDTLFATLHACAGRAGDAAEAPATETSSNPPAVLVLNTDAARRLPSTTRMGAELLDRARRLDRFVVVDRATYTSRLSLQNKPQTKKILVAVGDGLGNVIQVSPAIRKLAIAVGEPVDVLLGHGLGFARDLIAGSEFVGDVYVDGPDVFHKDYDVALFTACYGHLAPAVSARRLILGKEVIPFSECEHMHEAEYNLQVIHRLGLVTRPQAGEEARYFIGGTRYEYPRNRRIGFHAGCKDGIWEKKKWPYFPELARRLRKLGFEVVSFGVKEEYVEGTDDLTGTPLTESIRNIATCSYFVANDSGVMHIADGLGVPLTALFGPSSVVKNRPLGRFAEALVPRAVRCAPCQYTGRIHTCADNQCLSLMSVEEVLKAVLANNTRAEQALAAAPIDEEATRQWFPGSNSPARRESSYSAT
jgi:Tfp pilus assembly protein PilF